MLLFILMTLMMLGGGLVITGYIIETFVLYPKVYNKIGKQCYVAQSSELRNRYIEFYRKICKKEGSSLIFYHLLIAIEKYGLMIVKAVFVLVFLKIAILVITGLLNGQLQFVG